MKVSKYKIVQLFEDYSDFYQPYIPPIMDRLKQNDVFNVEIIAYNDTPNKDVKVFPTYYKRKFKEKYYNLFRNSTLKLNYSEIYFIEHNIGIVHLQHSFLFPKIIGLLNLPVNLRPKIVITLRGGDTYVKPWLYSKWAEFYKQYGNIVDAFVTMSEHQKDYLHSRWSVPKNRIHVIPISYGEEFEIKPKYPNKDKINIISAFRMCWEKNIDGNLRTIKLLKEKGCSLLYDIYGDGSDTGQLLYLIDKYNLSDCVSYHGKISNSELKSKLPRYDFFLQLSHSESLGMSAIEAQANGVPVIVSNRDGLPETLLNGKTGFCVAPHEVEKAATHILSLWKHPDQYFLFSKEAIEFVENKFTITNEVNNLTKLYLDLEK